MLGWTLMACSFASAIGYSATIILPGRRDTFSLAPRSPRDLLDLFSFLPYPLVATFASGSKESFVDTWYLDSFAQLKLLGSNGWKQCLCVVSGWHTLDFKNISSLQKVTVRMDSVVPFYLDYPPGMLQALLFCVRSV
jgi:hypothetical protein